MSGKKSSGGSLQEQSNLLLKQSLPFLGYNLEQLYQLQAMIVAALDNNGAKKQEWKALAAYSPPFRV